ncbi:NAD(P)H-quinone oxidoreductase subunit O, chloroplastic [Typha latifolia]|uniref:NAD(P)H-quinone oxidoreductase subunit O, chloroplastic n=1 Tax=Typha latifolia TaxID=4733 RepID=UPI003C2B0428
MASLLSRSSPLLSLFASKNTTAFWRRTRTLTPRINAAASSSDPQKEKSSASGASATAAAATSSSSTRSTSTLPKKPVYSMKKGQIVRVDKEKYLNSINYLSVDHPPYYKGLDYIYEDRGEVLDIRIFETGEYALIAWVGIPTAPAWLPTDMLIKSEKLNYERI